VTGGFDHPEALVRRITLRLDHESGGEVAALLERTLESLQRIHAASLSRINDAAVDPESVDLEVAMLLFRRASETT
jgi:hypothetical protein